MGESIYDVVIIGGGPAGYTAAIYAARARLSTLVLAGEMAGGQLMLTTEVENFPGFINGVMGPELMTNMLDQAKKFGAKIETQNVIDVDFEREIKIVRTSAGEYWARAVIVSTGAKARMLGLGEERLLGRGVSTCAVCDAAFFSGKTTAVVGGGDAAIEDVMALTKFAKKVYLIHRRDSLRASKIMQEKILNNEKVEIVWSSEVVKIVGDQRVEKIVVKDVKSGEERETQVDGLFLAIGHLPSTELFDGKLDLDEKGFLKTQMTMGRAWADDYPTMTSVKGVFGAGDVVDYRYKQAITSAGMGCQAALDVEKYLTGQMSGY